MRIDRLAATFGRLENDILEPAPGLNVIEAPNEGGKSTWTAFLRVMFYGLNTRDRAETADKRRFAPWSGSPMAGAMDVSCALGAVTVIRRTARVNAPMGAFSAVYTGTAAPVPGLDAAGCGEALLGVPEEVFVRSAFIRQSGIAVDQHSALERRVASLISTGEEDASYTDAAGRLRRQLNARRSSRSTGQLPQLEREIQALERALAELDTLSGSIRRDEEERERLRQELSSLREQLDLHDAADRRAAAQATKNARLELERAQAGAAGLPGRDELNALRASIPRLRELERAGAGAGARAEEAARALREAESDPPAREEGESAPGLSPLPFLLSLLAGAVLSFLLVTAGLLELPLAVLVGAAVSVGGCLAGALYWRSRRRRWKERREQADRRRQAELLSYQERVDRARERLESAQAVLRAARQAREEALDRLPAVSRDFLAGWEDLSGAELAAARALDAWDRLDQARRAWESLPETEPADLSQPPPQRPVLDRVVLRDRLARVEERLRELDAAIHTAEGRIGASGDTDELRQQLEEKTARHAALQAEYDAASLAMEVLDAANAQLQTRFSPALGRRAAALFARLTGGKYQTVLLDRDMVPSAQAPDQLVPRRAPFLSQGTADQLYLAVRLAVCDLVLPPEKAVPLILDDALVTFDDSRLAAALDYLVELSGERQILLFTCQRREAVYLRQAHPGRFHLISLTR